MVDHNLIWNISQLSKQFTPKLEYNVHREDSFDAAHLRNLILRLSDLRTTAVVPCINALKRVPFNTNGWSPKVWRGKIRHLRSNRWDSSWGLLVQSRML